jgi:hypothetical protein
MHLGVPATEPKKGEGQFFFLYEEYERTLGNASSSPSQAGELQGSNKIQAKSTI